MTDPKQIPYLVQLLDDESETVTQTVFHELAAFGPTLKRELKKVKFSLNPTQREYIKIIFRAQKRVLLKQYWPTWMGLHSDIERLERALSILSNFVDETDRKVSLSGLLDGLAYEYRQNYDFIDERLLAQFLFKKKAFKGNEKDYYNPQNSNLKYVIRYKRGIPISLAAVYILVGYRLGLEVKGCHYPGHFLARIEIDGRPVFVDCFSEGQMIEEQEILKVQEGSLENVEELMNEEVTAESIVCRFLANLIRAYQIREDDLNCQIMIDLFKDLDLRMMEQKLADATPDQIIIKPHSQFRAGQVIRHKRYGYRGIIVDIDPSCTATDSWYYGNQTQPDRFQPWHHVLVDGTDQVTYVAESSVVADDNSERINHPLITYFFTESVNGRYVRNGNPWPETDF